LVPTKETISGFQAFYYLTSIRGVMKEILRGFRPKENLNFTAEAQRTQRKTISFFSAPSEDSAVKYF
jgi:hypothetical protein